MEWIALSVMLLLLVAGMAADVFWLAKKAQTGIWIAIAYVLTANMIALGLGGLVLGIILLLTFMMVMGPAGTGSSAPEAAYWAALISAILLPLTFLVLTKRLFLPVMKIRPAGKPWAYSLVSSILLVTIVLVPTLLIYYLLNTLWT